MLSIPPLRTHKITNKDEITIVFIGDSQVGKSSIIATYSTERFPLSQKILPTIPTIVLQPQLTGLDITIKIVDTSSKKSNFETATRGQQIQKADVICIVFDVTNEESLRSIKQRWLPEITSKFKEKLPPILLIGNKSDLLSDGLSQSIHSQLISLEKTLNFDYYIECSAKNSVFIDNIFDFSSQAAISPSRTLFDSETKQLSYPFIAAISNIFNLLDYNRDGFLTQEECEDYLRLMYPNKKNLFRKIRRNIKDVLGNEGFDEEIGGITIFGFTGLHEQLIRTSQFKTIWSILHLFGYNSDLILSKEFLSVDLKLKKGDIVQLNSRAFKFLDSLFDRFDRNDDKHLNTSEIKQLYLTAPPDPFHFQSQDLCESTEAGITKKGHRSLWAMQCYLDYELALRYFRYFGYLGNLKDLVTIIPEKKKAQKSVILCYLAGATKCGKSTFIRSFLGTFNPKETSYTPTPPNSLPSVSSITTSSGTTKYLIIKELVESDQTEIFKSKFDTKIFEKINDWSPIPIVFITAKKNLYPPEKVRRITDLSNNYCTNNSLRLPLNGEPKEAQQTAKEIVNIALNPELMKSWKYWKPLLIGVGVVAAVGVGYLIYSSFTSSSNNTPVPIKTRVSRLK